MQNRHVFALLFLTLTAGSFAQSTNLSLPTSDNTSNFNVSNSGSATLLKLNGDAGFYVGGTLGTGTIPVTGAGSRMMWYPAKAAFRAGYLDGTGTQWDDANIGQFSIAMGYNPTAIGFGSVAIGANANVSVCNYSVAIGYGAQVTRNYSVAIGTTASATGSNALALGASASATSSWSAAIGYNAEASGIYSTALGPWVSTNGQKGACIIGDNSVETPGIPTERTTSTAPNQMMMRFDGGYVFYTKGDLSAGATLDAGQSSWSVLSDSTRKYAFLAVDGEEVLEKISRFNLRSWSYKGQDITRNRHYGPMAQEFFNAFGHDKYGTAGNDSTINQADFDGINLIAIQALEKRTRELHKAREKITELEQKIQEQNARLAAMENRFAVIEAKLREQAQADIVHLDDGLYLVHNAEEKE